MRVGYECLLTGPQETGVGIAVRELLSELLRVGDDTRFDVYSSPRASQGLPERPNVRYCYSSFAGIGRPCRIAWQQAIVALRCRWDAPDLYHATGYVVSPHLPVPSVLSIYDTTALEHPELTRWENAAHYRWAVPRAVHSACRVLVPSVYVKERLEAVTGVSAEKIEVIPLGVSTRFRPMEKTEVDNRLNGIGKLGGRRFVLFVGNLERKKNLATLIAAFSELHRLLPDVRLVLAGKPGNDMRRIDALVGTHQLTDEVVFTGYVDAETLVALYSGADLLAYPSLDEGFGLPPIEAMACGTAVIASPSGALIETTGGAALLVDPSDVRAWCASMKRLLTDPAERRELESRGTRRAAELTWQTCAQRVLGVYRQVAQRNGKVPSSSVAE